MSGLFTPHNLQPVNSVELVLGYKEALFELILNKNT